MVKKEVKKSELGKESYLMIENDLDKISNKIREITPTNWSVDVSDDNAFLYIERKDGKPMRYADISFFEDAATDIAKLAIEVKQLREINSALKKQIINQEVEKDLRFL